MPDDTSTKSPDLPQVEVFVVNYAGGDKLLQCVESLLASDYPSFTIRIIDNPPRDPAIESVKMRFPNVDIIESERNVGYAGAMHIAAGKCRSDLLVICNNDLVFAPGCLAKLVESRIATGAAAVSARVVNPGESAIESGYNATLNPLFFLIHGVLADRSIAVYPSGACFLIELSALRECLPPEDFFLYYEDVFIGMSLRISGRDIVQANDAIVHHDHGFSVARMNRIQLTFYRERNRHVCMFTFFSGSTLIKLALLVPLTLIHTFLKSLRCEMSFGGAFLAWTHASLSWNYIDKLRRGLPDASSTGESICEEFFTSRLVPVDATWAKTLNRFGKSFFGLFGIKTLD